MVTKLDRHPLDIRLVAVALSLSISLLGFVFPGATNSDAFTYIRTAEIFSEQGLAAAFSHYGWATYSILIGAVHQLLGVSLFTAAYLLQAVVFALLVFGFINLVRELDDSPRVLSLAALTVLVYPHLNEYRVEIIRDTGAWALILIGLWQFMAYLRDRRTRNAVGFYGAMLVAASFRLEALLYLFAIPISLLFYATDRAYSRRSLAAFTGISLLAVTLLAGLASLGGLSIQTLVGSNFSAYLIIVQDTLFPDELRSQALSEVIFGEHAARYSREYLTLFLLFGMIPILLINLWNGMGGPMILILAAGTWLRCWDIPRGRAAPIVVVIITSLLIMIAFLVSTRFLASRYVMMLCLMLALFVPLLIDRILTKTVDMGKSRTATSLLGILLAYCVVDAYITFGPDKAYVYETAEWIAANSTEQTLVITNNHTVAYFSGRVDDYDTVEWVLGEDRVLAAPSGSLFAVEQNASNDLLLASEAISQQLEQLASFGEPDDRPIVVYRRR